MSKINELSAFQKNFNYLTFYLYLMNTKCKNLQDYDDEGEFETHNDFFNLCINKFADKIKNDKNILLNDPRHLYFKNYFTKLKSNNEKKSIKKDQLSNDEKEFIYETYFEYSKTLPKSKFRYRAHNYVAWGIVVIIITILILLPILFLRLLSKLSFKEIIYPCTILLCILLVSGYYLVNGIIIFFEIRNKKNNKTKFNFMYSNDYCYKRIKECENFFRTNYNVENEILEFSEIERQFPETDNLFYHSIQKTKMSESNKQKLLEINKHVYCRAVFSELFNTIKEDGIEELQQIPFVFKACKQRANVSVIGNTGFVDCINNLLGKSEYTDTTFNQALSKLNDPENDIMQKYLKILKKYENILH